MLRAPFLVATASILFLLVCVGHGSLTLSTSNRGIRSTLSRLRTSLPTLSATRSQPNFCRARNQITNENALPRMWTRESRVPLSHSDQAEERTSRIQTLRATAGNIIMKNDEALSALIIGGGPAGLASAIMLADKGWNVKVLEQRRDSSVYEPMKAYVFVVDSRGQKFTNMYGLTDKLADVSVSMLNYTITRIYPDQRGSVESEVPVLDPERKDSYWIPRQVFVNILYEKLKEFPNAEVIFNTSVTNLESLCDDSGEIHARIEASTIEESGTTSFTLEAPDLVIGADGFRSRVRDTCAEWDGNVAAFTPVKLPSPSTGLRYKMIRLPPRFPLFEEGGLEEGEQKKLTRSINNKGYAVYSRIKDTARKGKLGLPPVKDPNGPRTANLIQWGEHDMWKLKSGEEVLSWLEENFPHVPIRDIISVEEAESFAKSKGGQFPAPQYIKKLYAVKDKAAAVLIGDAIHAFPPDIAQGVNAALEDVVDLETVVDQIDVASDIPKALEEYQQIRAPEAESLAHLAQIGYPFQYGQGPGWMEKAWTINFVLRTFILNKLMPFFFSPSVVLMIQDASLRYSEIWKRAQTTTRRITGLSAALALLVFWSLVSSSMAQGILERMPF